MRRIVMTGVSGLVGSSLAAGFLQSKQAQIISLSCRCNEKTNVMKSVAAAAKGFGYDVPSILDRIVHIEISEIWDRDALQNVLKQYSPHEVWHIASNMSYDLEDFSHTINFNVVGAGVLFEEAAKYCERFYYISTVGVAGPGHISAKEVGENLLTDFEPLNPYTVSKCFAEHMLCNLVTRSQSKLVIIRPATILGHSKTGWINDNKYGYYSYLHILKRNRARNITYYFDMDPKSLLPAIHIDHLVKSCEALRKAKLMGKEHIFNLVNKNLMKVSEHFDVFLEKWSPALKIAYGPGIQGSNIAFNRINAQNNLFMSTKNIFSYKKLVAIIGEGYSPPAITKKSVENVIRGYMDEKL